MVTESFSTRKCLRCQISYTLSIQSSWLNSTRFLITRIWMRNQRRRRKFSDSMLVRAIITPQYDRLLQGALGGIEETKSKKSSMDSDHAAMMAMIWQLVYPMASLKTKCSLISSSRAGATLYGPSGARLSITSSWGESRLTKISSVWTMRLWEMERSLFAKAKKRFSRVRKLILNCCRVPL